MTEHVNPLDLTDDEFLARAEAMCRQKAAFVTRAEATALVKRRGVTGTPYACPFCDHWHITTQDRKRSRSFTRRLSRLLRTDEAA